MMSFPLLQIIFFIAVYFAPQNSSQIIVTTPDSVIHWDRSSTGWSFGGEEWTIVDRSVIVKKKASDSMRFDVSANINALFDHNFNDKNMITLAPMETLEKTANGYIYRTDAGDKSENSYKIEYKYNATKQGAANPRGTAD